MGIRKVIAIAAMCVATAPSASWANDEEQVNEAILVFDGKAPNEFNAVVEQTPPYAFATQCQAELFWSSKDDWDTITRRARARARPER
jgi:hypothetical protein